MNKCTCWVPSNIMQLMKGVEGVRNVELEIWVGRMARTLFDFSTFLRLALLFLGLCPGAYGQYGFLSIDCGAPVDSYFDDLGLLWASDNSSTGPPYVFTGLSSGFGAPRQSFVGALNNRSLESFRYFPDPTSKHCYELPLISGISSLIRATFFLGNNSGLALPILFLVFVNSTPVDYIQLRNENDLLYSQTVEIIVYSPSSFFHFCLQPLEGVAFISSIEMRALRADGKSLYAYPGSQEQYLFNIVRLNCGSKPVDPPVRYPDDPFDRIWSADPVEYSWQHAVGAVSYVRNSSVNSVPPRVMADGWGISTSAEIITIGWPIARAAKGLYVATYFEELNMSFAGSEEIHGLFVRFQGNGTNFGYINTSSSVGAQMIHRYNVLVNLSIDPSSENNFNLVFGAFPWSSSGPFVNAIEIYSQHPFNFSTTAKADVKAMEALQQSFGLDIWHGDPCLPVAWDGVVCDDFNYNASTRRVLKILLSNKNINSSIPEALSTLTALTEIHLDKNSLFGPIPASLANLPNLTVLLLNNNRLTGTVPPALLNKIKTGLNFTYDDNDFSKRKSITAIVVGVAVSGTLLLLIASGLFAWNRQRLRKLKGVYRAPVSGGVVSLKAVLTATKNHSQKIGVGSYGSVYHGNLDGKEVAVKVNGIHSDQRTQEFITEVDILTRVHHRNLVSLLGYCNEGHQLILLYEFQANGTLREWLHTENGAPLRGILDWPERLQIALDAAKGLEYLHKSCVPPIIHRDVKTSNILLDENLVGKVADFGVSKTALCKLKTKTDHSFSSADQDSTDVFDESTGEYITRVKGTLGYLDPEYVESGILSPHCDVYSFGVVLGELLSGRPAINRQKDGPAVFLLAQVHECLQRDAIEEIVDPSLDTNLNRESMIKVAGIALACVRPLHDNRPDISEVIRNLEMAAKTGQQETITMGYPDYHDNFFWSANSASNTNSTTVLSISPTSSKSPRTTTTILRPTLRSPRTPSASTYSNEETNTFETDPSIFLDDAPTSTFTRNVKWGQVTKYS